MVAPLVAAAGIAAASSLAGGLSQRRAQGQASTEQRHFSREMFKKQTQLANTAHQRQVKDLRAAGLNPILSAKMAGAATPAAMGYQQPQYQNIGASMAQSGTQALGAANTARATSAEIPRTQAQTELTLQQVQNHKASQALTVQQTRNLAEEINNVRARAHLIAEQTAQAAASARNMTEQARAKEYENVYNEIVAQFFSKNEWAAVMDRAGIMSPQGVKGASIVAKDVLGRAKAAVNKIKNSYRLRQLRREFQ